MTGKIRKRKITGEADLRRESLQLRGKKIPRLQQARLFYREAVISGFFKRGFKPFDFLQMTGQILKLVGLFFIPDNLIVR